ncbi:PilZ domain-containing protein [Pseudenhygromyxa sp. WMMC2535]|uniref:PilZ domain-containing protein n=1 Tax=Pseudenhygromyxa sp. WMMC2535 TaxID=2712867 RepID=UPI001557A764|nr:PilZ domain-containing protein [Pseudenhygromyxa sp. WMMC2535]NVB41520.1 PilZ domain-containing protein [Pseudenhygromyxa sp. WMMC2535]
MQERRTATRIDKIFRVLISTEELGDQWHVARNISATGMFVEMAEPMPLRTKVIVRFSLPDDDAAICAIARVQNHYYVHYAEGDELRGLTGVGLRFLRFVPEVGAPVPRDRLH